MKRLIYKLLIKKVWLYELKKRLPKKAAPEKVKKSQERLE